MAQLHTAIYIFLGYFELNPYNIQQVAYIQQLHAAQHNAQHKYKTLMNMSFQKSSQIRVSVAISRMMHTVTTSQNTLSLLQLKNLLNSR